MKALSRLPEAHQDGGKRQHVHACACASMQHRAGFAHLRACPWPPVQAKGRYVLCEEQHADTEPNKAVGAVQIGLW